MGKCKKFYFLFLSLTYTKEERCFYRVLENNFLFLRKKIAIRLHFLKSYSFAIDNIELLLVLIIRIILSTYKFFPSSYAFFNNQYQYFQKSASLSSFHQFQNIEQPHRPLTYIFPKSEPSFPSFLLLCYLL